MLKKRENWTKMGWTMLRKYSKSVKYSNINLALLLLGEVSNVRKFNTSSITKDTLIAEAMEKCPEALGIFFEHGLHCVGCGGAAFETIEQGCQVHGMSEAEIEKIVGEINKATRRKKSK